MDKSINKSDVIHITGDWAYEGFCRMINKDPKSIEAQQKWGEYNKGFIMHMTGWDGSNE